MWGNASSLRRLQLISLVILDELGYTGLGPGGSMASSFLERYERGIALVTTNLEFSRWTEALQNISLIVALLDRLPHHYHVLFFNTESHQFP